MLRFSFFALVIVILGVCSGTPVEDRIVGGNPAPEGAYPHMVSLQIKAQDFHFCGGFIISNRTIVTAAHCVASRLPSDYVALAGTVLLSTGGTIYKVDEHLVHPDYNSNTRQNDIALVYTVDEIEFTRNVKPIELNYDYIGSNLNVLLTGWGRLSVNGQLPDQLQVIGLQTYDQQVCQVLMQTLGQMVFPSNVCTLTRLGQGACNGDSGGALTYDSKAIGVVNFINPCANGYPDVYARISWFAEWIDENTI